MFIYGGGNQGLDERCLQVMISLPLRTLAESPAS